MTARAEAACGAIDGVTADELRSLLVPVHDRGAYESVESVRVLLRR
jgi:hypothetical protein